jgi:hypothetical protein
LVSLAETIVLGVIMEGVCCLIMVMGEVEWVTMEGDMDVAALVTRWDITFV